MGTWACVAVVASVALWIIAKAWRRLVGPQARPNHPIAPERYERALKEAHEDKMRREREKVERDRGQW